MFKKSILCFFIFSCSQFALADNTSTNFKASASLVNSCQFITTDVNFGEYNPNNTSPLTTTQTTTILCTKGTSYTFHTSSVYNGVWSYTTFRGQWVTSMVYNNVPLYFQVKMPNGAWEDDMENWDYPNKGFYVGTGTGKAEIYTLQYRILENQYVAPGNYVGYATANLIF